MAAYQYIYVMKGLNKTYPGGKQVLKDIWLSFLPGAKIGVLGLNGSGKSTLLRIMAGRTTASPARPGRPRASRSACWSRSRSLDPAKDVLGNVMDGAGDMAQMLARFEEVSNAFSDPDADMDKLIAEQADLQEKIDAGQRLGPRPHRRDRDGRAALPAVRCCRRQALGRRDADAWPCAACCSPSPTCCCSTSRPTISTPSRWPGWSAISRSSPAPSWPSPTIATSSTTSPAGSSSSTAAAASRGKATTRPG
jgi:energy-coupling factor transporter ATP-binding protein EcfA2